MKIKLSKYWWGNAYAMLGQWMVCEIMLLYYLIDCIRIGCIREDRMIFIGLMVMWTVFSIFGALAPPLVFLMTMEIQDNVMKSFLFGRLKCEVFTDKEIYYVIFDGVEAICRHKTYIAVSNELFLFKKEKRCTFLGYYDKTKQIVFPYDEKTKHLFPIEKWTRVN